MSGAGFGAGEHGGGPGDIPEWAEGELRRGPLFPERTLPPVGPGGDAHSWELGGGLGRATPDRRRPLEPSGLLDEGRPVPRLGSRTGTFLSTSHLGGPRELLGSPDTT